MGLDLLTRRGAPVRRALAAIGLGLALAAAPRPVAGAEEEAVKAAFVYKFLSFVEWPEEAEGDGPVAVCLLGAPEVGAALEAIRGRHDVEGRPLTLRRIQEPSSAADCHALFLGAEVGDALASLLPELAGLPVLTVSDVDGFVEQGGMIGLQRRAGRLRFEVNRAPARRAGLTLSARLLRLAAEVRR